MVLSAYRDTNFQPELLFHFLVLREKQEVSMDPTRCPRCSRRMKAVATPDCRTGLRCLQCDEVDPLKTDAVKWAEKSLGLSDEGSLKPLFVHEN
jgi:tRNA(Ile2) C34 agmatinyltransferase TiaS